MSLSLCDQCQTIEGKWREATPSEMAEYDIQPDSNELEDLVCGECGSVGSYHGVPEYDDLAGDR